MHKQSGESRSDDGEGSNINFVTFLEAKHSHFLCCVYQHTLHSPAHSLSANSEHIRARDFTTFALLSLFLIREQIFLLSYRAFFITPQRTTEVLGRKEKQRGEKLLKIIRESCKMLQQRI